MRTDQTGTGVPLFLEWTNRSSCIFKEDEELLRPFQIAAEAGQIVNVKEIKAVLMKNLDVIPDEEIFTS